MRVNNLVQTCFACPTQYEGYTEDGRPVYIRYRWGYLSICIGKVGGNVYNAVDGEEIYGEQLGDGLDGTLDENVILDILEKLDTQGGHNETK
jgi:hypothetical protein